MNTKQIKNLITNFKRHYNLQGQDILACYDTAISGLFGDNVPLQYVTISISPTNWKALVEKIGVEYVTKHPGSNVECVELFDSKLYVRREVRVSDDNVEWVKSIGCYSPTVQYLNENLSAVVLGSKSTKKQVAHAEATLSYLKTRINKNVK